MIKRVVVTTGLKARGYVDGRYVGEERRETSRADEERARKRRGKAGPAAGRGKKRGATGGMADNIGNTTGGKRRRGKPQGQGIEPGNALGNAAPRGPKGQGQNRNQQARKNRAGKKTPFRPAMSVAPNMPSPSEAAEMRRMGDEAKSGQFAEALAAQANVKRERLHKVLAQSGHGSRRDMEIMISSGRVMVNGIVATIGTQVSPGDNVLVDHRPVKLKFTEELPRVLLYHKPEGEIVTTSDPGNRITVFDNLPRVENGKWVAIGRLDINTSGLLIFTTSGELANRLMHPRYEVDREYAVRILGELTEEQTQNLLTGVSIDNEDDEYDEPSAPARFDTIEKRGPEGGESANQWYHVTIKEGRNREVRKMFESQGLTVSRLMRVRFGKIELPPRLLRGKMMELTPAQVKSVLNWVGMDEGLGNGPGAPLPSRHDHAAGKPAGNRNKHKGGKPPRAEAAPGNEAANASGEGNRPNPANRGNRNRRNNPKGQRPRGPQGGNNGNVGEAGGNAASQGMPDDTWGNMASPPQTANASSAAEGNAAKPKEHRQPGNRNLRNRQRRNFRGRNNRNRNQRNDGGEEGGNGGGNEGGGSPPGGVEGNF